MVAIKHFFSDTYLNTLWCARICSVYIFFMVFSMFNFKLKIFLSIKILLYILLPVLKNNKRKKIQRENGK